MNVPLRQYWNLLVRYLVPKGEYSRPLKGEYSRPLAALGLALLLLASIGLQLANPQIMRAFLDGAQAGASPTTLLHLALAFLAVALVQQAAIVGATYLGENVAWSATNALRGELADHCLRLDMYFHKAHKPGEMIERLDGDITALSNFFSQFFVQVVGNGLLLFGVLALLIAEDWRVGLTVGVFAVGALVVLARLRNVAVPHWGAQRQASAELFGFLEERLAGTEEIRANGAEMHAMRGFYVHMRELLRCSLKAGLMVNLMLNSSIMLFALATAAAFAVGAMRYFAGALTIGSVYIVFYYTNMLERPINRIVRQLQDLQKAGASIVRVQQLLAVESRLPEPVRSTRVLSGNTRVLSGDTRVPSGDTRVPSGNGLGREATEVAAKNLDVLAGPLAVTFDGVSFHYHDEDVTARGAGTDDGDAALAKETALPGDGAPAPEPVLHDVSFHLAPGRVLGLLGRTGSGKTTITRLLFRLYDPDSGSICLGAAPVGDSGVVHQHPKPGGVPNLFGPATPGDQEPHQAGGPGLDQQALSGVDVRTLPLAQLRRRIGLVTQNIQLFHASVRDNLTFFGHGIPDERILAVLRDLELEEWVQGLPAGLDTVLDSGGGGLSAGEAQLLAFARVFLQDPGLVILDEASSRLDPATEALLERAVDRLLQGEYSRPQAEYSRPQAEYSRPQGEYSRPQGEYSRPRTAIVIAHHLGTVQRADEILILEAGRVEEHGVRAELARDPDSRFAQLLQTGLEEVLV
ncbi:MAG: ABC transporter ATP-binding protein [Anaerolineae bacterium]